MLNDDDDTILLFLSRLLAQYVHIDREETANPYVKLYLRPPIDQKLRQTSVQPQTIHPIWDEYFKFGVTNETVLKTTKTLYFYIYNYARSSRPACVGEAQVRLTSQTIHGGDLWCTINKQRAVRRKKDLLQAFASRLAEEKRSHPSERTHDY